MISKGIRGAITVENNTVEDIRNATLELVETILKENFETEQEAEKFVEELIKGHRERKENYDYDVQKISTRMRYYEYMETIED